MRNAGALLCALAVLAVLAFNVYLFGKGVVNYVSRAEMFQTLGTIWWLNLAAAFVSGLGNALYAAEKEEKANVLAVSGICGMFSFLVIGALYVFVGFCAGEIWKPIAMIFVTFYACAFIFFGTSYFVRVLRNIMPWRDEDFDEYIVV